MSSIVIVLTKINLLTANDEVMRRGVNQMLSPASTASTTQSLALFLRPIHAKRQPIATVVQLSYASASSIRAILRSAPLPGVRIVVRRGVQRSSPSRIIVVRRWQVLRGVRRGVDGGGDSGEPVRTRRSTGRDGETDRRRDDDNDHARHCPTKRESTLHLDCFLPAARLRRPRRRLFIVGSRGAGPAWT